MHVKILDFNKLSNIKVFAQTIIKDDKVPGSGDSAPDMRGDSTINEIPAADGSNTTDPLLGKPEPPPLFIMKIPSHETRTMQLIKEIKDEERLIKVGGVAALNVLENSKGKLLSKFGLTASRFEKVPGMSGNNNENDLTNPAAQKQANPENLEANKDGENAENLENLKKHVA